MRKIIISRTDSIGDVMLTLPICTWLKKQNPDLFICFLGRNYTKPVISCFQSIDYFLDWDEIQRLNNSEKIAFFRNLNADSIIHVFPNKEIARLAKKAKIKQRIGTSHRIFHLLTCNVLLNFTRKNSDFHESQLNFELLRPFGLKSIPTINEIVTYTSYFQHSNTKLPDWLNTKLFEKRKSIILHSKSQGSAVEWGLENYKKLTEKLIHSEYNVFFTGTEKEGIEIRKVIEFSENCIDTTGKLSLEQLIVFISKVNALVACSTGPLHIAGFLNIHAIGLFSPKRPIHPGRWKALGNNVEILVFDEDCPQCKTKEKCNCIEKISVDSILQTIEKTCD